MELRRELGLSARELGHWLALGILTATRRTPGGHHRFQTRDLVRARAAVRLRRSGLSLRQTARAVAALEAELDLLVACDLARGSTWDEVAQETPIRCDFSARHGVDPPSPGRAPIGPQGEAPDTARGSQRDQRSCHRLAR